MLGKPSRFIHKIEVNTVNKNQVRQLSGINCRHTHMNIHNGKYLEHTSLSVCRSMVHLVYLQLWQIRFSLHNVPQVVT